jgi:multidrug efflux system membrane fusion protein
MIPGELRTRAVRTLASLLWCFVLAGCSRGQGANGQKAGGDAAVPVHVAAVELTDVPLTIEGIGNVLPIQSVAVKSRVEGQIERVAVRDGAEVSRGDVLFQLDARPFKVSLDAARATLDRDLAQLEKARGQLRRFQQVSAQGYVSADQLAEVQANEQSAAATVAADRARVEQARLELEFTTLRSPINGRAGRVLLQVGNVVKAVDTEPLVTINQMDPVYVEFAVPERFLAALQQAAHRDDTTVELVATGEGGAFIRRSGPLTFLDNAVDQPTGTVRLRAMLDNDDRALWPGQYTRVTIRVPSGGPVLAVPSSAINQGPEGAYVYVVTAQQTAEQRAVDVARTDASRAVVTRGLQVNERVVTDGQSRVLPGGKLKVLDAVTRVQAEP